MITVLKILIVLFLIVLIIILVFRKRQIAGMELPENYREILQDYVRFYARLNEENKKLFEERLKKFLSSVKVTGANAIVEDLDLILIGSAAIIPVYFITDWEYVNLKEIILYPGNFNEDFEQHGNERSVLGMVGNGALANVMILSKWELRQGFIDGNSKRNTAIHEFVHLVDKMDGTFDGVPEILLERKYVPHWKQLIEQTIQQIRNGESDIDMYGGTNAIECFAVVAEYFFEQPEQFAANHSELNKLMERVFGNHRI
jgi:Mlc titration factor MtfA (ptsG expression regulator)